MKTYGELRCDCVGNYATNRDGGWRGRQSRKVARRRAADKRLLHRLARRVAKWQITNEVLRCV